MSALNDIKLAMSFSFIPPGIQSWKCSSIQYLAPFYVKFTQSITALKKYMEIHTDVPSHLNQNKGSLPAYIENNSKLNIHQDEIRGPIAIKLQNRSVRNKGNQFYEDAFTLLKSLSDKELDEVLARRINRKLGVEPKHPKSPKELKDLAKRNYLGSAARFIESYTHIGSFTKKIAPIASPVSLASCALFAASAYTSLYCCASLISIHMLAKSLKEEEILAAFCFGISLALFQLTSPSPLFLATATTFYIMQYTPIEDISFDDIDKVGGNIEKLARTIINSCRSTKQDPTQALYIS